MSKLQTAVDAAGFSNVCAFECSDDLHRADIARWRLGRRRNFMMAGGASFATLALAALLIVL